MCTLTTPPCSEGVLWLVLEQPVLVSAFSRPYRMRARPVQASFDRLGEESGRISNAPRVCSAPTMSAQLLPLQSRLRWAAAGCLGVAWLVTTLLLGAMVDVPASRIAAVSLALACVLALVWLALRRLERRALAPLSELALQMQSQDTARLPVPPSADELAVIAQGVNRLVDRLHEAQRHEHEHLHRIEEAVRARTQSLRAAADEALAGSQAKSRFLANLSHELRTPMNGVLGMSQMLSATELDATQRNYLDLMQRSTSGLLGLLDELLDFSRLEAHTVELTDQPLGLRALLDEVAATVYPLAAEHGLLFDCHLRPDLPRRVRGDTARLRQVCLGLLTNAIKFTQVGEVRLSGRIDAGGAGIVIEVSDTGPGIAPEMRERIFTPFVQVDDSLSRRHGGVGLGLTIVHTLVSAMGGRIDVHSEPGHGAAFALHLPLVELDDSPAARPGGVPLRVAVVSDTPGGQHALRDRLLFLSHACVAMLTWRELSFAPEILSDAAPDAVLYDEPPLGWPAGGTGVFANARSPWITVLVHRMPPPPAVNGPRRVVRPLSDEALQRALQGPLRESRPVVNEASVRAGEGTPRGPVLLVEDNEINQAVARSFLEHLGFDVDVSGDAAAALGSLRERDYAVILMDCQMPGMDGYETTRRIRAGEAGHRAQRTPIVALTAHASPADRQRCLQAGMDDYLTKPINVQSLGATLERWLDAERT
jgi:signal transduction histidine kinase/CheY-like chemotaxis protein